MQNQEFSVPVLGLKISRLGFSGAMRECQNRIRLKQGGYFCFVNVHLVTEALSHPKLRGALEKADLLFADGVPLLWTSHLKKTPIESRVCGPDLMAAFLKRPELGFRHGLIGGEPGIAEGLAKNFGIEAVCYSPPKRSFSPENAKEDWKNFRALCPKGWVPQLVWMGLGAPKQELWMHEVHSLSPETLFFGVGAAFDFLGGSKQRAPLWMQSSGLEWLHRLSQEPKRLSKRYLTTNSRFMTELFLELLPPLSRGRDKVSQWVDQWLGK